VTRELEQAGRALSTAAVLFHSALAARQGLTATETKTLDLISRLGPMTAGELGAKAGLAPASVTGLLDRLARKGFARRVRDPSDGRRVLVEAEPAAMTAFMPYFADFMGEMQALYATFTVEQLEVILRFVTEAARRQSACTARLGGADDEQG
jgi:DNA-binding MarR family transcriptional regulator